MGMKLNGLQVTLSTFAEVDRRFNAVAAREIEAAAKAISALAREYAPVDRGDLVKSIRAQRVAGGKSTSWRVKVGGQQGGRNIDAYALRVHETMAITRGGKTRGVLNPGKASRQKAASSGNPVGGNFLRRAYLKLSPEIKKRMTEALQGEVRVISRSRSRK